MKTTQVVFLIKATSPISRSQNSSVQGLVVEEIETNSSENNFAIALNSAMVRACQRAEREFESEYIKGGWEWIQVLSFQVLPAVN